MIENSLVKKTVLDDGKEVYKMATHNINVIAKMNGGLGPIFVYYYENKDVTKDIQNLRFSLIPASTFIEDYDQFQAMLNQKEQQAMQELYDVISIRPKNMTTIQHIFWSFAIMLLMFIPLFIVILISN